MPYKYFVVKVEKRAELIIGSSIGLPLNLEHQYPVLETEYRTSLQLIIPAHEWQITQRPVLKYVEK